MISRPLITLLLPVLAQAAVIRGSVVEHTTGKPLSRTTVAVQPIAGTAGNAVSKRTDKLGGFEFQGLAGGAYVVTFSRAGFAQAEYGQKEWNSAGYPIFLEEPAAAFLQVRLRRQGAISGTVLDDEDIGLPDHEVALYRNTRPPEFLTRAKTDDRGVYRFGGLMPGSYLVRTVGKHYDEGDYVPTFHRESSRVEDAQGVDVMLDEQVNNVNIKPRQGQLVTIDGAVSGGGEGSVVNVVLVSDMGRIEQQGRIFRFEHMPPGRYEVYAQIEAESVAGYMDLAGSTRGTLRLARHGCELSVYRRERQGRTDIGAQKGPGGDGPAGQLPRGSAIRISDARPVGVPRVHTTRSLRGIRGNAAVECTQGAPGRMDRANDRSLHGRPLYALQQAREHPWRSHLSGP